MDTIVSVSRDLDAVKARTGEMPAVHYVDEPVLLSLQQEIGRARGSQRNRAVKIKGVRIKAFQFVQNYETIEGIIEALRNGQFFEFMHNRS